MPRQKKVSSVFFTSGATAIEANHSETMSTVSRLPYHKLAVRIHSVAKHMFSDATENLPQTLIPTGQNVCEKQCRTGVEAGNLGADVFRQKFLGFGRTPPRRDFSRLGGEGALVLVDFSRIESQ